jgi:ABC-type tungstate transport system permease subunit
MNRPGAVGRLPAVFLPALLLEPLSAAEPYDAVYGDGDHALTVATGSPGELGLLEALAKSFNKRHDTTIRWKKAGSGASLELLREKKAYFMTDSSTWVAARSDLPNLKVLFRGDPVLVNLYHALGQPEGATRVQPYGAKFIDFLRSKKGQAIIRTFGKARYGEPLYRDAQPCRTRNMP